MNLKAKRKYGLVLTRKPDESIVIFTPNGQVVLTFFDLSPSKVKILFSMPDSIRVLRAEKLSQQQKREGLSQTEVELDDGIGNR